MGEIADMMLDGTLCQECGGYLGTDNGYPTTCRSCSGGGGWDHSKKVACPDCGKRVKKVGLSQHRRDAHGVKGEK